MAHYSTRPERVADLRQRIAEARLDAQLHLAIGAFGRLKWDLRLQHTHGRQARDHTSFC